VEHAGFHFLDDHGIELGMVASLVDDFQTDPLLAPRTGATQAQVPHDNAAGVPD
jgi:hypothetical protein